MSIHCITIFSYPNKGQDCLNGYMLSLLFGLSVLKIPGFKQAIS